MKSKAALKTLKAKAKENVTVTSPAKEIKGIPLDHSNKHNVPISARTVGMNKGITRNMGNFESLRVDVWLSDFIEDDETPNEALNRVSAVLDEVLEETVSSLVEGIE